MMNSEGSRGAEARDLRPLPKGHLHLHLDGSARPETIAEFARQQGLPDPDLTNFVDLPTFLLRYDGATALVQTAEQLQRMCREVIEDEAAAGVAYCEPIFAPHHYTARLHMTVDEVFDLMDEALQTTSRECGVTVRYLIGADRDKPDEFLDQLATFAVRHRDRNVVGLGYGGDERMGHEKLRRSCHLAREGGLFIVPHAGETAGPQSIREALDVARPRRIAHGIRAVEDYQLVEQLKRDSIACDVCPTSNLRLGVVPSLESHPLRRMVSTGMAVTLGADDRLFFGATVLDEYENARRMGLDDDQLAGIARTSLTSGGAPADVIAIGLEGIDRWLGSALS